MFLKKLELFDDKTSIICKDDSIIFLAAGLEGEYSKIISSSDLTSYEKKEDSQTCKIIFSLKHIRKMIIGGFCNNITKICLEHSYPMKISYLFNEDSYFVEHLAPKTDEDEQQAEEQIDDLSTGMVNMDVTEGCYDVDENIEQEKPKKRKVQSTPANPKKESTNPKKESTNTKKETSNDVSTKVIKKVVKREVKVDESDDTVSLTESEYNSKCEDIKMTDKEKKQVEKECFGSSSSDSERV